MSNLSRTTQGNLSIYEPGNINSKNEVTLKCNAAVFVVNANAGCFEAGVARNGGTRECMLYAFTSGIKDNRVCKQNTIVAVTAMDGASIERYQEIETECRRRKIDFFVRLSK